MKLNEIKQLNEVSEPTIQATAAEISEFAKDVMKDLEQEYKHEEAAEGSAPSAPDTTKFRAIKYGMIKYSPGEVVHGSYGSSTKYTHFFKMGTSVGSAIRKEILDVFIKQFEDEFDLKLKKDHWMAFNTSDGKRCIFTPDEGGSAWGGFGIRI